MARVISRGRRGRRTGNPRHPRSGSPARRLRVGLLLVAFVVSLFAGRLLQLQGVEASRLALQAIQTRLGKPVTLHAERGDITDRFGVRLATTVDTVAVTADPKLTAPNAAAMADILAPALGKPVLELENKLRKKKTRFVYLARHVLPEKWESARKSLNDKNFGGVFADRDPLRTYPATGVAGNVIGFVGDGGKGSEGLEYSLEDKLHGKDGWAQYERFEGRQIPLGKRARQDPKPGEDVRLTLDRDVQWAAQKAIADQVRRTNAESGSAVVMDAKTGDLLAVATAPTVDPSHPGRSDPDDRRNRPLQEAYEPGSVVKLVTAAALLDQRYVKPETKITVPRELKRGQERIGDYWSHGTIPLTFAGAIAKSSNIGTVLAAERMPKRTQDAYLKKFGIGSATGLRFPGEASGRLRPGADWTDHDRATISFGQGVSATAVQMTSIVATIANDGVRVPPRLVSGADQGKPARVIGNRAAEQVQTMMEAVTQPGGVATKAAIPGYRVAGKTGTSQRFEPACGCYRGYSASFGGFAPADGGRYVVYVVVHNPQGEHSGGQIAAPVFQEVMAFVLQKYRVPPTGKAAPKVPLTW